MFAAADILNSIQEAVAPEAVLKLHKERREWWQVQKLFQALKQFPDGRFLLILIQTKKAGGGKGKIIIEDLKYIQHF